MSNDQQNKAQQPSVSEPGSSAGSGSGAGRGVATAISLSFAMQHADGRQRFWPPKSHSGEHLADRHEGERWALELLTHYRDSERTAAPLLRRILSDALTDSPVDASHLIGFLRVIDDLLRLSARVVSLDDYGQALALQQQAERAVAQSAGAQLANPDDGAAG